MAPTTNELDLKVMAAINSGHRTLLAIAKACGVQGLAAATSYHAETRKIDRALQRMRKAKKIKYDSSSGWSAT